MEQILKEVEWTHDQMRKEHDQQQFQLQSQIDDLKRNSEIQEMKVREEVEQLWRSKLLEKDSSLRKMQEELDYERRQHKDVGVAKDFEFKQANTQLNELRSKLISLQAENDDLSNKVTLGNLDQNTVLEKQKFRIEKLEADIDIKETSYKERIKELTINLDKITQEHHSKELELNSLKERSVYEQKSLEDRLKLDNERLENSYKFQIRKLDDKIRDSEREIERLRFKDDTNLNKVLDLERKLSHMGEKKDQDWKSKLEIQNRELIDVKHNLQEKSNKLYLLKEKYDTVELNLQSKINEVKKLRFELKELDQQNKDLEDQTHNFKISGKVADESVKVSQLKRKIEQLENEAKQQSMHPVKESVDKLNKDFKIPFVDQPYTKKSKNSVFDDLNLDDDLSDESLLRAGSEFNETERLKNLKPEQDSQNGSSLRQENMQLKALISQMKDDMVGVANQKPVNQKADSEMNFFRNTNKKLLSQIDSEKEKFEILEKELELKVMELEAANSAITNISKKVTLKDKDIEVLIGKLKQQKQIITNLKDERDKFLNISNDLRGELNYAKKQGESRSEACIQDFQDRQLELNDLPPKPKYDHRPTEHLQCEKCKLLDNITTKNQGIQVNSLFEIPKIDKREEMRSNDRYQYNPEFIVSHSVGLDQNEEIAKLHNEVEFLRESMEMIKLEKARQTLDGFHKEYNNDKENYDDNEEELNAETIENLLKYREELDRDTSPKPSKMSVYHDSPHRDTQKRYDMNSRKQNYTKKRLAELKN